MIFLYPTYIICIFILFYTIKHLFVVWKNKSQISKLIRCSKQKGCDCTMNVVVYGWTDWKIKLTLHYALFFNTKHIHGTISWRTKCQLFSHFGTTTFMDFTIIIMCHLIYTTINVIDLLTIYTIYCSCIHFCVIQPCKYLLFIDLLSCPSEFIAYKWPSKIIYNVYNSNIFYSISV